MRIALFISVLLALFSIGMAVSESEPLSIGGEFGQAWLADFLAGEEKPVSHDLGNDLWTWGGTPNGYTVENGTLVAEENITIVEPDEWLMMAPVGEPMVIDMSSYNYGDWMSPLYSDDPWVLANHYGRPIAII
jgi:hypothetical protein